MDGHFGLVAFCVANRWNVLGMVIFIYRMPFGSHDIRTDYDATSSVYRSYTGGHRLYRL